VIEVYTLKGKPELHSESKCGRQFRTIIENHPTVPHKPARYYAVIKYTRILVEIATMFL
jgi:hypothetical protein